MTARRLHPRGRALRWLRNHRYLTESPADSNSDHRRDGIRAAQQRLAPWLVGLAWCGTWVANALLAAGVDFGTTPPYQLAGVARIEDLARARRKPYPHGWITTSTPRWWKRVLRGDSVVLFGRGVHVETVRSTAWAYRRLGLIRTEGGNTSSGDAGDQAHGGGSYPRWRRIADIHGFALVDYPDT